MPYHGFTSTGLYQPTESVTMSISQQANRSSHLCRDAEVCWLSTGFVFTSPSPAPAPASLPLAPKTEQPEHMAKPNYTDMAHAFMALSKAVSGDDPVSVPSSTTEEALNEPIYSSNDVKQMMLTLERKQADRAELEHAMEEVVKRRVSKGTINKKRTGRRQDLVVESSASEEEDEQVDDSYTTVPIRKRIHKMMKGNGKKAKLSSRKRAKNKKVREENSDSSDTDRVEDNDGEEEIKSQVKVQTTAQMKDQINQIHSMLATLMSAKELQQQSMKQTNSQEKTDHLPVQSLDKDQAATGKGGATSMGNVTEKGKAGTDVKSSGLDDEPKRDIVAELFK